MEIARRPLNRVEPKLPASAMRSHLILAPEQTHFRAATCEEIQCPQFLKGYGVPLKDIDAEDLGLLRSFIETYKLKASRVEIKDGEWHLWFEAGQRCLRASTHRMRIEKPEIFVVRDGDHRGNPLGTDPIIFSGADAWADSLQTNLDKLRS